MRMKYFWIVLNSIAVLLAFRGGYTSMTPDSLRHTNPEPALCLIVLLTMPLFTILSVMYSIQRWKTDPPLPPLLEQKPSQLVA
jgi:hypothetical protein